MLKMHTASKSVSCILFNLYKNREKERWSLEKNWLKRN